MSGVAVSLCITSLSVARVDTIVATGDPSPDGVGLFVGFDTPRINGDSQVLFGAALDGVGDDRGVALADGSVLTLLSRVAQDPPAVNFTSFSSPVVGGAGVGGFRADFIDSVALQGVFTGSGGPVIEVAREGAAAPGTAGVYNSFDNPSINTAGQVTYWAQTSVGQGIFTGSGAPVSLVAIAGQPAPDLDGVFDSFASTVSINDAGEVAFLGFLTGTAATQGVFRGTGLGVDRIARVGQEFETGRSFAGFSGPSGTVAINNAGDVAFLAVVDETGDGVADTIGLYAGDGSDVVPIAERGDDSPDGNGDLFGFNNPAINSNGVVGFIGTLSGSLGGPFDNTAIFTGPAGGLLQIIVREGESVPSGNGVFREFGTGAVPSLSDGGQVMFKSLLSGTSGGVNDDEGIFIADAQEVIEITRESAPLGGSMVLKDGLEVISTHDPGGRAGLNNHGQVAFSARLQDGSEGVFLYTPDLKWRAAGDGDWDTDDDWTLGLTPAHVHDVLIDPAGTVVVRGPASSTTVRSLRVGGEAGGSAELVLQAGGDIVVDGAFTVEMNGSLSGSGRVVGDVVNEGRVRPGGSPGIITVDGGYEQGDDGVLRIELAGTDNSDTDHPQFDQLIVTGGVSLGGRLEGVLDGGFVPAYGDTFEVITFASRGGTVFDVAETLIDTTLGLAPDFSDTAVTLRATVPGDLNFDDAVSVADLSTFALNFGTTPGVGSWDLGDFNGDGGVTVADLSLLALNFGFSLSSPAIGMSLEDAAVMIGLAPSELPEPHTLTVIASGALLIVRRGRWSDVSRA